MFADQIYVKAGDPVTAGQHIADIGLSGYTTGPHPHFEIRPGGGWSAPVDPEPWLLSHGTAAQHGATTDASGCTA
jgi:murein DD-endopeptidase MepM/ murein hydrolase activator NlpD